MLVDYVAQAYNYGGYNMRAKTLFLIIMIMAYGYYLRTMSAELDRRVAAVKIPGYWQEINSDNRAMSVVEYILSKGIAVTRIISKGYGETKPVADNNTFEGKANNRRVEFVKL